jgi:class 3 adenylate cyclase
MQTQTSQDGALRRLRPRQFRLESLLLFWVLAIFLPALAIFGLLNFSVQQQRETVQADFADQLLDAYDKLNKACEPGAWFVSQVEMAETIAGLPPRNSKLQPAANIAESAAPHLNRLFSRIRNHDLLLLMAAGGDLKNLTVFTDPVRAPDFPRPGLRAAREILGELLNQHGDQQQSTGKKDSRKILRSFITSTFGTYLDPVDADEDFTRGFSEKSGTNRLRTARRLIKDAHGKVIFIYIALFRETDSSLAHSFALARRDLASSGLNARMVLKPARPFPFIHTTADNQLKLVAPINISLLTSGIFKQKDQITDLLNRGIMAHRPALYPHFEISATPDRRNHHEKTVEPGFIIFLFLCLTLLALKSFHQHGNLRVNIRTRLFLSVLLATVLPVAIFVFYTHRHLNLELQRRQSQMSLKLKSHLQQLELAIKAGDHNHFARFSGFINRMREFACTADEDYLRKFIHSELDRTFSGAGLLRNDGLILEFLDYQKVYVIKLEKKLNLTREFMYASIIRFFQLTNLMPDRLQQHLQSTSRGKKLLAMAEIFPPIDVDNFCSYEGTAQTSKQDFGNFRMMNYKILPPANPGEQRKGAVLLLIQDIRELAHLIVRQLGENWQAFRQTTAEGLIESQIISSFDLNGSSLDLDKVWPEGQRPGSEQLQVARLLTNGRAEAEIRLEDKDGTPVLISGRKIAGYPLIAVASCRMSRISQQRSLVLAIIGANLVYIFLLLSMLVSILSELFNPPIDRLLNAARLTGEGMLVRISNSFSNELSQLTNEFNRMSQHIRERERLERFISPEATRTIVSESRTRSEVLSRQVRRSIVFMHIRHFSELNTALSPEQLFQMLNLYFPFVEAEIADAGGQIDKYIGDAIMAVFSDEAGLPAARRACNAMIRVMSRLPEFNRSLKRNGLPEIVTGAGISTGEVILGRIGSYQGRLDYTVIGDRVNLAARLEASSHFDNTCHILTDADTLAAAGAEIAARLHGEIKIKGKALPVKVYEIIY